jgi:hypothetical protein
LGSGDTEYAISDVSSFILHVALQLRVSEFREYTEDVTWSRTPTARWGQEPIFECSRPDCLITRRAGLGRRSAEWCELLPCLPGIVAVLLRRAHQIPEPHVSTTHE